MPVQKQKVVTDVTKLELDALVAANGLYEGFQYHCVDTDIDWLLLATGNNTLNPIDGKLALSINDANVPAYIFAGIITVDTGFLTNDISIDTGDPQTISFNHGTNKYFPKNVVIIPDTTVPITDVSILLNMQTECTVASLDETYYCNIIGKSLTYVIPESVSLVVVATGNSPSNGNGVRFIAEYFKV